MEHSQVQIVTSTASNDKSLFGSMPKRLTSGARRVRYEFSTCPGLAHPQLQKRCAAWRISPNDLDIRSAV